MEMMLRNTMAAAVVLITLIAPHASATVEVDIVGSGTEVIDFNMAESEYEVTLTATGPSTTFYVYATTPSDISGITVINTGNYDTTLVIGRNAGSDLLPPSSLDELDYTGSGTLVVQSAIIDGDLGESGESHSFRASGIVSVEVTGDAYASIIVDGGLLIPIGIIALDVGGDLHGSISVPGVQPVGSVFVQGSIIGNPLEPVILENDDEVSQVIVLGDAQHFVIRRGQLELDTTLFLNDLRVDGPMTGDILPTTFGRIRIGRGGVGDFSGAIEYDSPGSPGLIEIGGTLTTDSSIIQEFGPFYVRVVINNNNSSDLWLGEISYDSEVLGNPQYTRSEDTMRGSTFGQVPFLLHGVDSTLEFSTGSGPSVVLSESTIDEVMEKAYLGHPAPAETLIARPRFFGLVKPAGGWVCIGEFFCDPVDPAAFEFERRPVGGSVWTDITACYGDVQMRRGSTGSTVFIVGPDSTADPLDPVAYRNGFEYRIIPNGDLFCDIDQPDPMAVDVPVGDDALRWRVGNYCSADFDGDGFVDSDDLGMLLSAFDTSDSDGACGEFDGDADGDNDVDSDDLGVLLSQFGGNCSEPEGLGGGGGGQAMAMQGGGGGGGVPSGEQVVAALGFESVEAFVELVSASDPEAQLELIAAAWIVAAAQEAGGGGGEAY
ncbi:MAG: hypothetical protein ACTS3F_02070 [Phycisphaerales bacterium]